MNVAVELALPLYALIQARTAENERARVIAANNILNALFMIASSLIAGTLLKSGFTVPQVFLFTGIANAVVAAYIFLLVPEYLLRFVAWVASRFVYRFKVRGDEHIPTQGAAVLVCNHVSFVDAVLLMAASPRPIRFLMDHRIFQIPVLGWLFRLAKAIPVAPRAEDPAAYEKAMQAAAQVLREHPRVAVREAHGLLSRAREPGGAQEIAFDQRRFVPCGHVVRFAENNVRFALRAQHKLVAVEQDFRESLRSAESQRLLLQNVQSRETAQLLQMILNQILSQLILLKMILIFS